MASVPVCPRGYPYYAITDDDDAEREESVVVSLERVVTTA